jgi:CBS domain-containing protein
MRIKDIMTRDVELTSPDETIRSAAQKMLECDCGILPVGKEDRLVGMITDRDIVTRAVARGVDPDECHVGDVMSPDVKYVFEDESTEDLARNMMSLQLKRLPVLDRKKRLVGIVSLGDLATTRESGGQAQAALRGISQPNGSGHHAGRGA